MDHQYAARIGSRTAPRVLARATHLLTHHGLRGFHGQRLLIVVIIGAADGDVGIDAQTVDVVIERAFVVRSGIAQRTAERTARG